MNFAGSPTLRDARVISPPIVSICVLAIATAAIANSSLESRGVSAFAIAANPKMSLLGGQNFGRLDPASIPASDLSGLQNVSLAGSDSGGNSPAYQRSVLFSQPSYQPLELIADSDHGGIRRRDQDIAFRKRELRPDPTSGLPSLAQVRRVQARYSASRMNAVPSEVAATPDAEQPGVTQANMIAAALPERREGLLDGGVIGAVSAPSPDPTAAAAAPGTQALLDRADGELSALPTAVEHTQTFSFKQASAAPLEHRFDQELTAKPAIAQVAALVNEPAPNRALSAEMPQARSIDIEPAPVMMKRPDAPPPQASRPALAQGSQALVQIQRPTSTGQSAQRFSPQPFSGGIEKPHQTSMGIEFNVPALVNGKAVGRLPLLISNRGAGRADSISENISIRLADMIALLKPRMDPALYDELSSAENSKAYVTLNDFRARGISVSFSDDDRLLFQFK